MRILLDEDLPRRLADLLVGHQVFTVQRSEGGAVSNRLVDLRPLVPKLLTAMQTAKPGAVTYVEF